MDRKWQWRHVRTVRNSAILPTARQILGAPSRWLDGRG
jgi:hypothetical protein